MQLSFTKNFSSLKRSNVPFKNSTFKRSFSTDPALEMITVEKKDKVAVITLNRPKALNALCEQLLKEVSTALKSIDKDNDVGCVVFTGAGKAFAAGADIKEMQPKTYMDAYKGNMFNEVTEAFRNFRKPTIAAVNGFALGGGCEFAMMCDIIIASEAAVFGQPEIKLGTIPGIGGTQRLTRAIGKAKAMELILTGNQMSAKEAELAGLVARVVPADNLIKTALDTAGKISSYSKPVVSLAKECVNRSYESSLEEGLLFERRVFYSTFALNDQKEGMRAFAAKEAPKFTDN